MSEWIMQSDAVDSRILPARLGSFLRREVGGAKQLALLIDCDERTAFKIRAGEAWPIARHFLAIWLEFGDDVVEALFHPDRVEERLRREREARDQARRTRASTLVESCSFSVGDGLAEGGGADEDPAELGPPNLDLFVDAGTMQ